MRLRPIDPMPPPSICFTLLLWLSTIKNSGGLLVNTKNCPLESSATSAMPRTSPLLNFSRSKCCIPSINYLFIMSVGIITSPPPTSATSPTAIYLLLGIHFNTDTSHRVSRALDISRGDILLFIDWCKPSLGSTYTFWDLVWANPSFSLKV